MCQNAPAAWYGDPFGRHEQRYWDGDRWTDHVSSGGQWSVEPPLGMTPDPVDSHVQAGWHPDPLGRHEQRYWDGSQWTDHVHSRGLHSADPPAAQAASPTGGRANKKVARQVRRAGAADGQTGGGTLFTEQVLVVNQEAKVFGSRLGYAVFNQSGQQLGMIHDVTGKLGLRLTKEARRRQSQREATRERRYQVVDMSNRLLLAMTRPKMGFLQLRGRLVIDGPGGAPIGQIAHESYGVGGAAATAAHAGVNNISAIAQVGIGGVAGTFAGQALQGVQKKLSSAVEGLDHVGGHARFGLEAGGQRLGSVHAESVEQWEFNVQDPTGTEIARITKTWAGWAKERFTKADNYVVQMHRPIEEPLRSLVIAAAFAIDIELKQRGHQTRGSSVWGTRRYK
jgi:hypothetical protein